jgi:ABC-type antimicrobial peptide transport system permease subunit
VAVINQAMADRYWPGQEPLGRSFANADDPTHPALIVGVVRNLRMGQLYDPYDSVYFRPITQAYAGVATLQIKSSRGSQELVPEIREIVESLSPGVPIYGVRTMTEAIHGGNGLLPFELGASLAGGMGALGLVLALVGVYGLTSYAVSQRTQEIGIRMALGAQRLDILRAMVREGLVVTVSGLIVGLLAAFAVGRLVGDFLVGITPTDPTTYVGVSALLAAIVLLATYVPARRASGLNPIMALRHE